MTDHLPISGLEDLTNDATTSTNAAEEQGVLGEGCLISSSKIILPSQSAAVSFREQFPGRHTDLELARQKNPMKQTKGPLDSVYRLEKRM